MILLRTVKGDKNLGFIRRIDGLLRILRDDGRSAMQIRSLPDGKIYYSEHFREINKIYKGKFDIL
jgi:hypothetical protein